MSRLGNGGRALLGRRSSGLSAGLTLIEVVAATALLALLMVGLLGWLRNGRVSAGAASAALQSARSVAAALALLRDDCRRAEPAGGEGAFIVNPSQLRLVARTATGLPDAAGEPELTRLVHVRYRFTKDGQLWRATAAQAEGPWQERLVLAELPACAFISGGGLLADSSPWATTVVPPASPGLQQQPGFAPDAAVVIRWQYGLVDADDPFAGADHSLVIARIVP